MTVSAPSGNAKRALATVTGYACGAVTWALVVIVSLGLADREPPSGWLMLAAEVVTRTSYGYQFALLTIHLWGSLGSIVGYLLTRPSKLQFRLMHVLLVVFAFALLLGSVRWLYSEIDAAQLVTPMPVSPFKKSASLPMVLIGSVLALIVTVLYKLLLKSQRNSATTSKTNYEDRGQAGTNPS